MWTSNICAHESAQERAVILIVQKYTNVHRLYIQSIQPKLFCPTIIKDWPSKTECGPTNGLAKLKLYLYFVCSIVYQVFEMYRLICHLYAMWLLRFSGMQEIAGRLRNKAKVSSVLLFTDGRANVGSSSADAILREMKTIRVSF